MRGKQFEQELTATHDWYRFNRKADIVQNPNEWQITTEKHYSQRLSKIKAKKASPGTLATTDKNQRMLRVYSDVDFSGGGENFSVMFDAKETSVNRLPIANIRPHQIDRLYKASRCGVIAGLMVKLVKVDRVFFIPAAVVRDKEADLLAGRGSASFSISDLEDDAVEIRRNTYGLWDWLSVLTGEKR